jgi:hypothetical protein
MLRRSHLIAALMAVSLVSAQEWGTLKGKFVWEGDVPAPVKLDVTKDDHCIKAGNQVDTTVVIDPATKGIGGIIVYVRKPTAIHPSLPKDAKAAEEAFEAKFKELNGFAFSELKAKVAGGMKVKDIKGPALLDQVNCVYVPTSIAMQQGTKLIALNPEPIAHNVKVTGTDPANAFNPIMPANTFETFSLVAEPSIVGLECNIHGWMKGGIMVLEHPYFAVTGKDGSFEIKNVPAGDVTVIARLSNGRFINVLDGGKGTARGQVVKVAAGGEGSVGTDGVVKVSTVK